MLVAHLNPVSEMSAQVESTSVAARILRYTSAVAAGFVFADVVWGGIVRINGAGMTCPDWPRCRGAWFPALDNQVALEWTHRFVAPVLTLLILATIVAAWRARRELPRAWRASWLSGGLLVAQIIVGALTIRYINNPPSVAAHLGLGILTFVSLLVVWYAALPHAHDAPFTGPAALALSRLALSAAVITFFAILAAGYMSASNAGLACTGFPICNGWGPATTLAQQIHVGHRLLAYASFIAIAAFAFTASRVSGAPRDAVALAWTSLVLACLQVTLGAATVISGLAPALRSVHQANGALLFACVSLGTYALYATLTAQLPRARAEGERAVLQTS
jgi:heme A synthase